MSIEEVSLGVDCGCTCPGCGDKGISPSPPPVLVADQVIALNVGLCRMCGAPLDRIRVGDGFYAGREALRCRTNGRHPFILISDAEAPRAP